MVAARPPFVSSVFAPVGAGVCAHHDRDYRRAEAAPNGASTDWSLHKHIGWRYCAAARSDGRGAFRNCEASCLVDADCRFFAASHPEGARDGCCFLFRGRECSLRAEGRLAVYITYAELNSSAVAPAALPVASNYLDAHLLNVVYATDRVHFAPFAASLYSLLTSAFLQVTLPVTSRAFPASSPASASADRLAVVVAVPTQDVLIAQQLAVCTTARAAIPDGLATVRVHTFGAQEARQLGLPPAHRLGASPAWLSAKGNLGAASNFARFFLPDLLRGPERAAHLTLYLDSDVLVTCDALHMLRHTATWGFRVHTDAVLLAVEQPHNPNGDFVLPSTATDALLHHARGQRLHPHAKAARARGSHAYAWLPPREEMHAEIAATLHRAHEATADGATQPKPTRESGDLLERVELMARFLDAPSFNAGLFVANLTRWAAANATGQLLRAMWAHVHALEAMPSAPLLAPPPQLPLPPPPPPRLHECKGRQFRVLPQCEHRRPPRNRTRMRRFRALLGSLAPHLRSGQPRGTETATRHTTPWMPGAITSQAPMLIAFAGPLHAPLPTKWNSAGATAPLPLGKYLLAHRRYHNSSEQLFCAWHWNGRRKAWCQDSPRPNQHRAHLEAAQTQTQALPATARLPCAPRPASPRERRTRPVHHSCLWQRFAQPRCMPAEAPPLLPCVE